MLRATFLSLLLFQATQYPIGTRLRLTASPDAGWLFNGWSGTVNSPENPFEFVITEDTTVNPSFIEENPTTATLTMTPVVGGSYSVVVVPDVPDPPVCGNSIIELGEQCDDGNVVGGDGCSATCQTEQPPSQYSVGWTELPNTKIRPFCLPNGYDGAGYPFNSFCEYVIRAWNGGALNTVANQLIVWGGGHADYKGNEIYAINLTPPTPTALRLNNPSLPLLNAPADCPGEVASDGAAGSRHTYDGLEYLPAQNKLFVIGGGLLCGSTSREIWLYDFASGLWARPNPAENIVPFDPGLVTALDNSTGRVYIHATRGLFYYDPGTNSVTSLGLTDRIDYHMTAEIHQASRKLVILGGGWATDGGGWVYSLDPPYNRTAIPASPITAGNAPGVAYDGEQIVAWTGGDSVFALDLGSMAWTEYAYPGGPGLTTSNNGTFGRWRYSPALDAFVVVNSVDQNAFIFRLP